MVVLSFLSVCRRERGRAGAGEPDFETRSAPLTAVVAAALKRAAGTPAIRFSRLRLIDERPLVLEDIWLPHDRFEVLRAIDPREIGDLLYPLYDTNVLWFLDCRPG